MTRRSLDFQRDYEPISYRRHRLEGRPDTRLHGCDVTKRLQYARPDDFEICPRVQREPIVAHLGGVGIIFCNCHGIVDHDPPQDEMSIL